MRGEIFIALVPGSLTFAVGVSPSEVLPSAASFEVQLGENSVENFAQNDPGQNDDRLGQGSAEGRRDHRVVTRFRV